MEVVAVNQTVLSLSASLHTRRLFIQGMCVCVFQCVNAHVHVCICRVTPWFVFFLYRWFCPLVCIPGSVSFLCMDGLVIHWEVESGQTSSCLLWFLSHSVPRWGLALSISISLCLFSFYLLHSTLCWLLYLPDLCLSFSLPPCHSFTTSISSAGTPE